MHHLVLGIDPTPLGSAPFTLATSAAVEGRAATSGSTCRSPRSTPGRASPVTSAPTPRRWCWPRDRTAATRCGSSSTSAPTPRSCSATATGSSPRRARRARRSKAPRSAADSGRRPVPSRACASTRRRCDARVKVIGVDPWSDEPGFEPAVASHRSHRAVRLGDHRPDRRDVPRRDHRRRRHDRRRQRRHDRRCRRRRADVPLRLLPRRPQTSCRSPRTTCGRCNSPRPPCGPVSTCCSSTPATRPSPTSGSPGRSARTSTRCTRWSSASSPTARSTASDRSATPPVPEP